LNFRPNFQSALARNIDFRDEAFADVEELLFERAPGAVVANPSVSKKSAAKCLGMLPDHPYDADLVTSLLSARRLDNDERREFLRFRRTDPVVCSFVSRQQPTPSEIAQLLAHGFGTTTADYLVSHIDQPLEGQGSNGAIIDRASPLTRMIWLARSSVGDYAEYADRWIANAPAQLSPWVPRLAARQRPDLMPAFITAPHRKVREAAARSGYVTSAADQATLLNVASVDQNDSTSLLEWLTNYGPIALALLLSTAIDPGLLTELRQVASLAFHAAKVEKSHRRAAPILRSAVSRACGSAAELHRASFWVKETNKAKGRPQSAEMSVSRFPFAPAPSPAPYEKQPCSEVLFRRIARFSTIDLAEQVSGHNVTRAQMTRWFALALGTDRKVWETMLALAPEWSLTLGALAETAAALQ
jgi:hypothetical protein